MKFAAGFMALQKDKIKRIVVLAPKKAFFGANIVQIPFFQHLRAHFPQARIILWSPVKFSSMMLELKLVDELHTYSKWKDYFKIVRFLWKHKAHVIINMRWVSEGMNLITAISAAKYRVGFKNKNSPFIPFFNKKVKLDEGIYMGYRYMDLLKPLGVNDFFDFKEVEKLDGTSTFTIKQNRKIVCFMPAGGEGEHKRWGIENFCALGKLMRQEDTSVFLYFVIGPQENEYLPVIQSNFNADDFYVLQGGSLGDIVKVSNNSLLTVANDCGPSHLAQMCGGNYIGVWGWKEQHPQQRIISWTVPRPNAVHVVAQMGEDIKTVTPEDVMKVAKGFIDTT